VPKGSVGIAGTQTGVYPLASPGGWQIIGKTNVELFTPNAKKPTFLQAGDTVKFYSQN
jgi:inhibitor of KinA